MKKGVLPDFVIKSMIDGGLIKNAQESNINPASLDLSISDEIYRVSGVFQFSIGEDIYEVLDNLDCVNYNLDYHLEKDVVYLIRLNESLNLPHNIYGFCNPKSSTGRNDIHVRVMTNNSYRYDTINKGYKGDIWALVVPKSYPIKLNIGDKLTQVRFFTADTRIGEAELMMYLNKDHLIWYKINKNNQIICEYENILVSDKDGSILLKLGNFSSNIAGYRCKNNNKILDFSKIKHYDPMDFFEYVFFEGNDFDNSYIHLKKDNFYILSSAESIMVPPHLACEMVPMDERFGEFRAHYAGFIDPGWGYSIDGNVYGRQLTLEIRPFEDVIIRPYQHIAKIRFEKMYDIPHILYDAKGNYTSQHGPTLSKHFKEE